MRRHFCKARKSIVKFIKIDVVNCAIVARLKVSSHTHFVKNKQKETVEESIKDEKYDVLRKFMAFRREMDSIEAA